MSYYEKNSTCWLSHFKNLILRKCSCAIFILWLQKLRAEKISVKTLYSNNCLKKMLLFNE